MSRLRTDRLRVARSRIGGPCIGRRRRPCRPARRIKGRVRIGHASGRRREPRVGERRPDRNRPDRDRLHRHRTGRATGRVERRVRIACAAHRGNRCRRRIGNRRLHRHPRHHRRGATRRVGIIGGIRVVPAGRRPPAPVPAAAQRNLVCGQPHRGPAAAILPVRPAATGSVCRQRPAHRDLRAQVGRDRRHVVHGLVRQPPALRQVVVQPLRPGVVGGQERRRAVFPVHLADIGGAGHDVVVRLEWIAAQVVLPFELGIGRRHQLHQPHRPGSGGDRLAVAILVPARLLVHHRPDPLPRHAEPIRRLLDVWPPRISRRPRLRIAHAARAVAGPRRIPATAAARRQQAQQRQQPEQARQGNGGVLERHGDLHGDQGRPPDQPERVANGRILLCRADMPQDPASGPVPARPIPSPSQRETQR